MHTVAWSTIERSRGGWIRGFATKYANVLRKLRVSFQKVLGPRGTYCDTAS